MYPLNWVKLSLSVASMYSNISPHAYFTKLNQLSFYVVNSPKVKPAQLPVHCNEPWKAAQPEVRELFEQQVGNALSEVPQRQQQSNIVTISTGPPLAVIAPFEMAQLCSPFGWCYPPSRVAFLDPELLPPFLGSSINRHEPVPLRWSICRRLSPELTDQTPPFPNP